MARSSHLHIYFLLDRSGSMESLASDVVGGFNSFLKTQQADGPDALLTLVQFDSEDPHEILTDAAPIRDASRLAASQFRPRGATPLYDAIGRLIADATIRGEKLAGTEAPAEEILFVTFTDGLENQSVEYTRKQVFDLVKKREEAGWTFVFLGTNQDSYAEGGAIGYSAGNTQNFAADAQGTHSAYASLAVATSRRRQSMRSAQRYDKQDFFEGDKEAERDLEDRRPS